MGECTSPETHDSCPADCSGVEIQCVKGELIGSECVAGPPEKPKGIDARAIAEGDYTISWTRSYGAEEYVIYYTLGRWGPYQPVGIAITSEHELRLPPAARLTPCYRITARNRFGESPMSDLIPLTVPNPGDFNEDGTLDDADLNIILANFGTNKTWADGDFDGDGAVTEFDVSRWGEMKDKAVIRCEWEESSAF